MPTLTLTWRTGAAARRLATLALLAVLPLAAGAAEVRNVQLPADYSHVYVAATSHLARDPALRDWINSL